MAVAYLLKSHIKFLCLISLFLFSLSLHSHHIAPTDAAGLSLAVSVYSANGLLVENAQATHNPTVTAAKDGSQILLW